MRHAGGVDVGSTQTKAVVVDGSGGIIGRSLIDTGANVVAAAERAFTLALEQAALPRERIDFVIGTGYGRYKVEFGDAQVTEIACHARGAAELFPGTRTVLDMGGQDTKAIRLGERGDVLDFCMNDKCAAGTGRFLQSAAAALELDLAELGPTALRGRRPVPISTTCTVFAESEVLSWLARGRRIEDILLGVHRSIAQRSFALLRRVGVEEEIAFTGGVTRNTAMVQVLNELLDTELRISDDSHYMGALGAALFALERAGAAAAAGAAVMAAAAVTSATAAVTSATAAEAVTPAAAAAAPAPAHGAAAATAQEVSA
jgi:(R)-2-hydroxyacyl-CoA dehydratese activating ATPase